MSMPRSDVLSLAAWSLIAIIRVYFLAARLWNQPLAHGSGFFLGVAVAPGFYEGAGARWLKSYRAILLAEHLLVGSVFSYLVVSLQWNRLGILALIDVPLFLGALCGFGLWTRHALGASPPKLSGVAVALESRRLGDYVSWPLEVLIVALIAGSGLVLLLRGDAEFRWQVPLLQAYVVMGLLPAKIIAVRGNFPLPPERTEEHHRWMEANRRFGLRLIDLMRWFGVVVLAGYALRHGWPAARATWVVWLLAGVCMGIWLALVAVLIRGGGRLAAMGRDLRPVGSWSSPYRPAPLALPGALTWGVAYTAGLALLLFFLRG